MAKTEHRESHDSEEAHDARFDSLTTRQAYCLFLSHALSMSNSRMYEFGVVSILSASSSQTVKGCRMMVTIG